MRVQVSFSRKEEEAEPVSPSPLSHRHLEFSVPGSQSRRSLLTAAAPSIASKRPSLVTNGSSDHMEFLRSPQNPSERAVAWRDRGKATAMLRTASDGADVVVEEGGLEWEVVNPHGRGKREEHHLERRCVTICGTQAHLSRHSLQDRLAYQSTRVSPAYVTSMTQLTVANTWQWMLRCVPSCWSYDCGKESSLGKLKI